MSIFTIESGFEQAMALVESVTAEDLDRPTPCADWDVRQLVDHLVNSAMQFSVMARGGEPDWSALADHHDDPAAVLRQVANDTVAAFNEGSEAPEGMIAAELAVHTWDLATALGRDTSALDSTLAEKGYAFVSESLTEDRRGDAFGPEQSAPEDANAYERIAAYAGRTVRS